MFDRRHTLAAAAALAFSVLVQLPAFALDKPKGRVILTVSGQVSERNAGAVAEFDMDMLAALPQQSFTTMTPWYKQPRKFTGPLLRDVLAAVGAKGTVIKAVALNDYKAELPLDDARQHGVILARLMDDKPMAVRDKGPLFIVYPFDSDEALRSERYYNRSAWQLKLLEIE
ncbi:MAG: molybdopterin-dependent oxidoreductase [Leptothrix sp. (in: b-proteobacteria)]